MSKHITSTELTTWFKYMTSSQLLTLLSENGVPYEEKEGEVLIDLSEFAQFYKHGGYRKVATVQAKNLLEKKGLA